jgi:HEAT repeat protein
MSEETLFQSALALLKPAPEEPARFPLHWLSDLSTGQSRSIEPIWRALTENARRDLIGRMSEEARENFELDFTAVARIALRDADPEVRIAAIHALVECEDRRVADSLLAILLEDSEFLVRAAAAAALGQYMEWSELGEVSDALGARVEAGLRAVLRSQDHLEVRRKALESVGYSSREDIREHILAAHKHPEESMRRSALAAMGHSLDSDWEPQVTRDLESGSAGLRAEAARAAGEIALRRAVPALIELLSDTEGEVRKNAVWALGEIGGGKARHALNDMIRHASPEEEACIAEALDAMDFEESLSGELPLLDLDDEEDEDEEAGEEAMGDMSAE